MPTEAKFESKRLYYKTLSSDDVSNKYVGWLNDPLVNRYLETRFLPQTLASCEAYVNAMQSDICNELFGMYDRTSGEHIGNIKLGAINQIHSSGVLSLFLGEKSFWGKGYATEAIAAVSQWGFSERRLRRIEAGCYDVNLGSLRAFLKAGYSVEGFRRKSCVFEGRPIGAFLMAKLFDE